MKKKISSAQTSNKTLLYERHRKSSEKLVEIYLNDKRSQIGVSTSTADLSHLTSHQKTPPTVPAFSFTFIKRPWTCRNMRNENLFRHQSGIEALLFHPGEKEKEAGFPHGRLTKTEMKKAPDEKVPAGCGSCETGFLIAVGGRRCGGRLWSGNSGDYE